MAENVDSSEDDLMIQLYNDTLEKPAYFRGSYIVGILFYMYLARRYQTNCLFAGEKEPMRLQLVFEKQNGILVDVTKKERLQLLRQEFAKCMEMKKPLILFLLGVHKYLENGVERGSKDDDSFHHENLIIFRRATRTFEHFEPHGDYFLGNFKLGAAIENLILNALKEIYPHPFDYVPAYEVCPSYWGVQSYESFAEKKDKEVEGGGYCVAWSLFFAEMCLRNPHLPSSAAVQQKIDSFLEKYTMEERKQIMRKIIRSYARRMGQVLYDHYLVIFQRTVGIHLEPGETINPDNVIMFLDRNEKLLWKALFLILNMELDLIANPELVTNIPEGEELNKTIDEIHGNYAAWKWTEIFDDSMKYSLRGVHQRNPWPTFQSPKLMAQLREEEQALVDSHKQLRAAERIPTKRLEQKIQKYQKPSFVNKWLKNGTRKLKKYQGELQAVEAARQMAKKDVASRRKAVEDTEEALRTTKPNFLEELEFHQKVMQPAMKCMEGDLCQEDESREELEVAHDHLKRIHNAYHGNIAAHPMPYGGRGRRRTRRR